MSAQNYYGGGGDEPDNYNQGHETRPPMPSPPYPWRAEWEARENRYVFVNGQTGEKSNQFPGGGGDSQRQHGAGAAYDGGYGGGQYGGPSGPGGYERPGPQYQQQQGGSGYPMGPQGDSQSAQHEEKKKSGHGWMGAALGVAAGLAGGAFLMHEGEEAKEHFEQDKSRTEQRVDDAEYRTEEFGRDAREDAQAFPEDVASYTGRQVGRAEEGAERFGERVEDAPEDIANYTGRQIGRAEEGFERFGERVEDAPEDVAEWTGRKVGEFESIPDRIENKWDEGVDSVESFGDNVDNAYDQGRAEGYDDGNDGRRDDDRW